MDVRSTKDGEVLVCHDSSFKKLAGVDKSVTDLNLNEVPKKYIDKFEIDFGHHDYEVKPSDKAEFCTLEQLFASVPKTQIIQMDIKDAKNKATCMHVRRLIDKYDRAGATVVGTMWMKDSANVRDAMKGSNVLFYATFLECWKLYGLYITGLLPFVRYEGYIDSLTLPWMTRDYHKKALEEKRSLSMKDADYWMVMFYMVLIPLMTTTS